MTLLLAHDDGTIRRKLLDATELAREAAVQDAGAGNVGDHVAAAGEDAMSVTHLFEATLPGYRGWRWSVTVATADEPAPVTISEVVLMPGPDAIVAPRWIPWERRVRPGDLGVGDIFPTHPDDARLSPAYATLDTPEAEEAVREIGLGRVRVLSRLGRQEAATRWHHSEYGPRSDMARSAPATCGTCGFYLQLAGSLRSAFGVCGNEISPADGHVVHAEFGCGAHSEVEIETTSSVPVAALVYDDSQLDLESAEPGTEPGTEPGAEPGTGSGAELDTEPGTGSGAELDTEPGTGSGAEPAAGQPDAAVAADAPAGPSALDGAESAADSATADRAEPVQPGAERDPADSAEPTSGPASEPSSGPVSGSSSGPMPTAEA